VTTMQGMFNGAVKFNQDISNWNTAQVTRMDCMFHGASVFNQNIGSWSTAKVTDMSGMFYKAEAFNQDINAWDVQRVTSMSDMFYNARGFQQPLCWNASTANTVNIFTGTGRGNKPAAAWGKLSARNNCEYNWVWTANRQSSSGTRMNWPFVGATHGVWIRYGKSCVSAGGGE
jgi:surface protein